MPTTTFTEHHLDSSYYCKRDRCSSNPGCRTTSWCQRPPSACRTTHIPSDSLVWKLPRSMAGSSRRELRVRRNHPRCTSPSLPFLPQHARNCRATLRAFPVESSVERSSRAAWLRGWNIIASLPLVNKHALDPPRPTCASAMPRLSTYPPHSLFEPAFQPSLECRRRHPHRLGACRSAQLAVFSAHSPRGYG